MRKKRFVTFILTVLFSLLFFTSCFAFTINIPKVESNVYIYDQDDAIDDDIEKRLNSLLVELEKKTSIEFVVISIPSLQGMSIEQYSIELANKLGIGKKSSDNGILLLFTKSEKDFGSSVRLEIGSGIEGVLNDAKCGRILDQYFVPYRNDNNYTEATDLTVRAIITLLAQKYNVDIISEEAKVTTNDSEVSWSSLPLALRIFIIALLVFLFLLICLAPIEDDGYHSSYRGGGHFHSGGFGGGFGGGGFHGGGASR